MTIVREIMTTAPGCIGENEILEDAARKMRALDVGALPICGEDNRLKGMVGDRDIVIQCLAIGTGPRQVKAGRLAQSTPFTVGADESVEEAIKTMTDTQVRCLPVLDGHDLVGMITQADIARTYPRGQVGELGELISFDER